MLHYKGPAKIVICMLPVIAVVCTLLLDGWAEGASDHEHLHAAAEIEWAALLDTLKGIAASGAVMLLGGIGLFTSFIWPGSGAGEAPAGVVRLERWAAAVMLITIILSDTTGSSAPLKMGAAAVWLLFALYQRPRPLAAGVIKGACALALLALFHLEGANTSLSAAAGAFSGVLLAVSASVWLGGGLSLYVALPSLEEQGETINRLFSRFAKASRLALGGAVVSSIADLALRLFAAAGQADPLTRALLPLKLLFLAGIAWLAFSGLRRWRSGGDDRWAIRLFRFRQRLRFALSLTAIAVVIAACTPSPLGSVLRIPQEPVYWHVMGTEAHMSLRLNQNRGNEAGQRIRLDVWLPGGMGEPAMVEVALQHGDSRIAVPVAFKSGGPDPYGFEGFDKYSYEAAGVYISEQGEWRMTVEVTDGERNRHSYEKTEVIE
ncbi:hypothetical protein [Paenibacillus arenilitoris]|uniref:Copper resistance protein D domain-containing protein n=1 Tax=Paenibacillus arenilitoris TaxID=2772299 RepID=A0A927CJ14_9BACL|nr:hypothetical protein [Paenibacillus arenilitoris]MBD2868993.1 hypothetical protein [Paenibacillus arenilitoris]